MSKPDKAGGKLANRRVERLPNLIITCDAMQINSINYHGKIFAMFDENGSGPSSVAQEAQRLSNAIAKLFVEEKAAANTGMIALCISMGNAIKQFSDPNDFEPDLRKTMEIIRRVATNNSPVD